MTWMNEHEIDEAIYHLERVGSPMAKFARYLGAWRDVINSKSDGWAHWRSGTKPADRLSDIVKRAVDASRGYGREVAAPTEQEALKALAPIRSAATRHKFDAPDLAELSGAAPVGPGGRR